MLWKKERIAICFKYVNMEKWLQKLSLDFGAFRKERKKAEEHRPWLSCCTDNLNIRPMYQYVNGYDEIVLFNWSCKLDLFQVYTVTTIKEPRVCGRDEKVLL